MLQFLVCKVYRERIIVSSMRLFNNLDDALNYYQKTKSNRFYEFYPGRGPYLVSSKKVEKMILNKNSQA